MAALTSAGHLAASCPGRSPAFTPTPLPDILPPTTPTSPPPSNAFCRRGSPLSTSRLRQSLAGSPVCCGRIVFISFVFITVCQVPFVASHPASRRRSYFQFSARMRPMLAGVSHSGGCWRFAAHGRATLSRLSGPRTTAGLPSPPPSRDTRHTSPAARR